MWVEWSVGGAANLIETKKETKQEKEFGEKYAEEIRQKMLDKISRKK
jgi:nitrogenase subunit NifH